MSTIAVARPNGCLSPVLIDDVVAEPERIRQLARDNGPYFMPARYLFGGDAAENASGGTRKRDMEIPAAFIGPVWRGDWCTRGNVLVPGTEDLLHDPGFTQAAKDMCQATVVVPEQVYVNLTTPMTGTAFSHIDIPEFVGRDRTNAPGWFLQAMGTSQLFEDVRITIVTAVAWFHRGERGYFRYWPNGRDDESVRHENMWNTAVVGDNDFMHHKVERVGPDNMGPPDGMTIDTTLEHDGAQWVVREDGTTLASYDGEHVRLSLSWKAKVYADVAAHESAMSGDRALDLEATLARFADALDEPLAASGPDALSSPELRTQLSSRWAGYVPG